MNAAWVYEGVWGILAAWFRVPREAPMLPGVGGEAIRSFRPDPGYLRYLKVMFWIVLLVIDLLALLVWIIIAAVSPLAGAILFSPALLIIIVPDLIAYVAIHLRYDTTWYVMSARSIRIRRGVWIIAETTITFENIQNISIHQGPLQRHFGIADIMLRTAGGGSAGPHGHGGGSHLGLIQGIADAPAIRDQIEARVRASRSAGLGDDKEPQGDVDSARLDALRRVASETRLLRTALGA